MCEYKYWSNKKEWHDTLLFECKANNILEADKLFESVVGIQPIKAPWVGCQILKNVSQRAAVRQWFARFYDKIFKNQHRTPKSLSENDLKPVVLRNFYANSD